jgi:hypothetical protein
MDHEQKYKGRRSGSNQLACQLKSFAVKQKRSAPLREPFRLSSARNEALSLSTVT